MREIPALYEVAKKICHDLGMPWTDPRTGVTHKAPVPLEAQVYGRKGTKFSRVRGRVVGRRDCTLESCGAVRLGVRWPDGRLTWPCTRGMRKEGNTWRIQ